MKWIEIERDKDGFATHECLEKMAAACPIVVSGQHVNFIIENMDDGWRKNITRNTEYSNYYSMYEASGVAKKQDNNIKDVIDYRMETLGKRMNVAINRTICADVTHTNCYHSAVCFLGETINKCAPDGIGVNVTPQLVQLIEMAMCEGAREELKLVRSYIDEASNKKGNGVQ